MRTPSFAEQKTLHRDWHLHLPAIMLSIACLALSIPTAAQTQTGLGGTTGPRVQEPFLDRFFYAVSLGKVEQVRDMLKQHPSSVHLHDAHGLTPLHVAAKDGRTHLMRLLLSAGANPNARSKSILAETPLHLCADRPSEAVSVLTAAGADINIADTHSGGTPLHRAVSGRVLINVTALLKAGAKPSLADSTGRTALHFAFERGYETDSLPILKALLAAGANPNAPDREQSTPLHSAPYSMGMQPLVDALLEAGANPAAVDKSGNTPLHEAARRNQLAIVASLLARMKKMEIALTNKNGATALDLASSTGNAALISTLQQSGIAPTQQALDNAAHNGDAAAIAQLMQSGMTPTVEQLMLLLDQGAHRAAQALTAKHPTLKQTLNPAVAHAEFAKLFPNRTAESISNMAYQIHALVFQGKREEAQRRLREFDKTACGEPTPLMDAVERKSLEAAQVLLELGADANMQPPKPVRTLYFPAGPMSSSGISSMTYVLPPPCEPYSPPPVKKPEATDITATSPASPGRVSEKDMRKMFERSPPVELSSAEILERLQPGWRLIITPRHMKSALIMSVESGDLPMAQLLVTHGADPKLVSLAPRHESAQSAWLDRYQQRDDAAQWQKVLGIADAQLTKKRKLENELQ
jgi:ankyrin repeat protein